VFVLLDSNVWLAALSRDGICRRVVESSAASCTPVVTPFICAEVRDKLLTKFQRTEEHANELVSKLVSVSLLRDDVGEISSPLRDPDDNPILGAAVAYRCEFLVTGDDDLLELKFFSGVEIISVRAFAERLRLKID
jgi:putative PIN family toxin of toxin-antitoxin system